MIRFIYNFLLRIFKKERRKSQRIYVNKRN
jgi:hypothetical protein